MTVGFNKDSVGMKKNKNERLRNEKGGERV